jgi:type IV pilus assembly protein PilA
MSVRSLPVQKNHRGFTLIELMIVIAILGIGAGLAMPSYQDRVIRAQVAEGIALAEMAKQAIAAEYARNGQLPADNAAAGLPPADHIVGNYVSSLAVEGGAVQISFGQLSNRNLAGKVLSLRPATVPAYRQVPIAWVCGRADVPSKMNVEGQNRTTLPGPHLPVECRKGPGT